MQEDEVSFSCLEEDIDEFKDLIDTTLCTMPSTYPIFPKILGQITRVVHDITLGRLFIVYRDQCDIEVSIFIDKIQDLKSLRKGGMIGGLFYTKPLFIWEFFSEYMAKEWMKG